MSKRVYEKIRSLVEHLGGQMTYERKGTRYGAWVIDLDNKHVDIKAEGKQSYPLLDRLFVPRVQDPRHWDDYSKELVPDAETQLRAMLGSQDRKLERFTDAGDNELTDIIERTKWKFAWTYARTYPHEYTTKALCSPENHAQLISCIERYGVVERFGDYKRKYFYYGERKYWHMGNPDSENPEEWPNVINRSWIDVRRHADNVKHVWTSEEVELQTRLWEIHDQRDEIFKLDLIVGQISFSFLKSVKRTRLVTTKMKSCI